MKIYLDTYLYKTEDGSKGIEFDQKVVTLKEFLKKFSEMSNVKCFDINGKIDPLLDISINGKICMQDDITLNDGDTVHLELVMLGGG